MLPDGRAMTVSTKCAAVGAVYVRIALDFWEWARLEPEERVLRARQVSEGRKAVQESLRATARVMNGVSPSLTPGAEDLSLAVESALKNTRRVLNTF